MEAKAKTAMVCLSEGMTLTIQIFQMKFLNQKVLNKTLIGVGALGTLLVVNRPADAVTALNFDCFEFGVVTVGERISAPSLKLFDVKVRETLASASNYVLEGKNIKFQNGHLFGGPVFTYKGKSVSCKYI